MKLIMLNGSLIDFNQFPNGETKVDGNQIHLNANYDDADVNLIHFKYDTDADLIHLMFLKRDLDENSGLKSILNISYMPYSRMDRKEGNSVFTLKYVCEFINNLHFDKVYVNEAHSDVTPGLLNNCTNILNAAYLLDLVMLRVGFDAAKDYLFFPDQGAAKRYSKLGHFNTIVGFKKRNFETSKIESLEVMGEMEPGRTVIILDDLLCKGKTSLMSAEKLKEMGAGDIYVAATHCEKTVFEGAIPSATNIQKVFTSDSILDKSEHEKVEIIFSVFSMGWKQFKKKTEIARLVS